MTKSGNEISKRLPGFSVVYYIIYIQWGRVKIIIYTHYPVSSRQPTILSGSYNFYLRPPSIAISFEITLSQNKNFRPPTLLGPIGLPSSPDHSFSYDLFLSREKTPVFPRGVNYCRILGCLPFYTKIISCFKKILPYTSLFFRKKGFYSVQFFILEQFLYL